MGTIEVQEASPVDLDDLTTIARAVEGCDPLRRPNVALIERHELEQVLFRFQVLRPKRTWIAHDRSTGSPVGRATVRLPMAANRHHVEVHVEVVPDARQQGIGSALLARVLTSIDQERSLVSAHVEPGAAAIWCESIGLESRLLVRESELDVVACDHALVRRWLDPVAAVAAGYRIVSWRGPSPDELLPAVCVALASMADAPMDDADHEDPVVTPELVRDLEAAAGGQFEQFASLVIAPDGSPAGFTELGVNRFRSMLGDQGDTAVVAEHRGHRLGRWLKAANLLAALAENPELRFVHTYNAESNPWMLAINEDMGFRPFREVRTAQGPTAAVLDAVHRRTTR